MQYDRKITISAGSNRRAMTWQQQTMLISELWAGLQTPARGTETLAEYQAAFMKNRQNGGDGSGNPVTDQNGGGGNAEE